MMLHRFKKKLIELGHQEFCEKVEAEFKERQQCNKKPKDRKIKKLDSSFTRVAFKLAYVGINYHGLESQINQNHTIETHLFKCLQRVRMIDNREDSNYTRAGRTDKGVSALGNVIALNVRKIGKQDDMFGAILNRVLPEDIQILDECIVDEKFNARYDCTKRVYKYYFYKMEYNMELIQDAMMQYLGEHDFRNFCKLDVIANQNFVRTIMNIYMEEVFPDNAPRNSQLFMHDDRLRMYCVTIEGNAFLWHQIRYMMAVLFMIGKGIEQKQVIPELFNKLDGKPNYQMAPDYPLVLYNCEFPQELWKPTLETHTSFIQGVYETLRENLCKKYIEFLHFYQMGISLLKVPVAPPKVKTEEKKSLTIQKSGVTVQGAIESLKGKRKEKYEIKIQRVKEYQERCLQKQNENQ